MPAFLNDLLKSRRFWVTVGSLVAITFKDKLPFTEDQLVNAAVLIGSWVIGESLRSSSLKVEPLKARPCGKADCEVEARNAA